MFWPRFAILAVAVAMLLAASASAQEQTSDPDHIDPATLVPACTEKKTSPCATSAPKVVSSPDPKVPKRLRDYRGIVVLYLVVGTDGRPHNISVARSLQPELDKAAIEVMKKWKFKPATDHGTPVPVAINIEINFPPY